MKVFIIILALLGFANVTLADECIKPEGMPEYVKVGSIFNILGEPYIFAQTESYWSEKENKVAGKFTFIGLNGGQLWSDAKEMHSICSDTYGHAVPAKEICVPFYEGFAKSLKTNPVKYIKESLFTK